MTKSDLIDIACTLRHETERAYFIDAGCAQPVWVPKSLAEYEGDPSGDVGVLTLPEWLAKEKGLI